MSEDLIKRTDAIEAVWKPQVKPNELIFDALKTAIESEISNVPSADRPQGEWIDKGKNLWKCSNCEMVIYSESEQDRNEFHKWCSRCGARMKGADDEVR